jgi:hypothetical protein
MAAPLGGFRCCRGGVGGRLGLRGALQFGEVDFDHLQHGLEGFGVLDELRQAAGGDLPGEAESVLKPAALDFFATGGELGPVVVYFLLGVAADDERDGIGERVHWSAVERSELLAVEFESDSEDAADGALALIGDAELAEAAGVLEDGEIEVDGLFCVAVEPEEGRNAGKLLENADGCLQVAGYPNRMFERRSVDRTSARCGGLHFKHNLIAESKVGA